MIFYLILFFLFIISVCRDRIRVYYLAFKMNGPIALPLIENFQLTWDLSEQYGKLYRVWAVPQLMVVLTDPLYTETILSSSKHITKSYEYRMLSHWLKEGLLLSTGSKWFQRRKILTPAFHFSILEGYIECFNTQSSILVNKLKTFKPNESIGLQPLIALCALDIICETTMGYSPNAQSSDSEYAKAVRDIATSMIDRFFNVFQSFDFIWQHSQQSRKQRNILKVLHRFTENVIEERRMKLNGIMNNNSKEGIDDTGIKQKKVFIDILLNSTIDGKPMTDEDIREEVDTFMFEGHDTTTSAILFGLYNIAKEPEVQRKCFDEIKYVFGNDKTRPAQTNDINDLQYLDLVIKETLRLFPSVPFLGRHLAEEVQLYDGTIIPKNTDVLINLFYMGTDSTLDSNPEKFCPERFETDSSNGKNNHYLYTPFSVGPRNCVGQKFALLKVKSTISKILRNFEISLTAETLQSPIALATELILISKKPLYFHLQQRV